jgi:Xaa-Pro aminopeptidase
LFRHDSYFYYLSGFTEPNAWLVITADGHSTLFCQPKDLEREIWDGIRLGPRPRPWHWVWTPPYSVEELDQRNCPSCWRTATAVWYPFATTPAGDAGGRLAQQRARPRALWRVVPADMQRDLCVPCSTRCA